MDLAEALKAVLRGNGGLVDDKVSLLRCNWIAVTSRAEEWLNLLLVSGGRWGGGGGVVGVNMMLICVFDHRAKNSHAKIS